MVEDIYIKKAFPTPRLQRRFQDEQERKAGKRERKILEVKRVGGTRSEYDQYDKAVLSHWVGD